MSPVEIIAYIDNQREDLVGDINVFYGASEEELAKLKACFLKSWEITGRVPTIVYEER